MGSGGGSGDDRGAGRDPAGPRARSRPRASTAAATADDEGRSAAASGGMIGRRRDRPRISTTAPFYSQVRRHSKEGSWYLWSLWRFGARPRPKPPPHKP